MSITVQINGEQRDLTTGTTLAQLLNNHDNTKQEPVVVAVNGQHVPGATQVTQALADGDQVEILTVRQGG